MTVYLKKTYTENEVVTVGIKCLILLVKEIIEVVAEIPTLRVTNLNIGNKEKRTQ